MPDQYYSQFGQDEYLDRKIFKKRTNGFFIDIGANDGITFSNTFFFEKERAWKGICIEPHPTAFAKLEKNRNSKLLNIGISDQEAPLEFLKIEGYSEMLSGIKSSYDADHLQRIENEIKEHGGSSETIVISCKSLMQIVAENNIETIDYCSIDIEGGEYNVLQSMSPILERGLIHALSVENNYYGNKLEKFLKRYNYKLHCTLKSDEIYVKKKTLFF